MKWRTEINPLDCRGLIDLDSRIVTIGSCFADEIGGRLLDHGFDISVNPSGIMFNPASIAMELDRLADLRMFTSDDLVPTPEGDFYVSFMRHSSFKNSSPGQLLDSLNLNLDLTRQTLSQADFLFLTLGSSRCFVHKATDTVVANCHRYHPDTFSVRDLSERDTIDLLSPPLLKLMRLNPRLRVILTVSPVRHASYGLVADSLSKARLIVAAHSLVDSLPGAIYFPAYEALVDDLRDYRFYASDLVHPSEMAVDYIFQLFSQSFLSSDLQSRLPAWRRLWRKASDGLLSAAQAREAAAMLKASQSTTLRLLQCLTSAK